MEDSNPDFEIIECICSWYDLLGFGQPLMDSAWDLTDMRCKEQLNRVTNLDLTFSNIYSHAHGTTTFSLNDGIISNFDINTTTPFFFERLIMVIDDLVLEFENLNNKDVRAGFPGVRGIISFGHRYNYTHVESTKSLSNNRIVSYHPQVFQMNTAFSKAFIIESSGSKAGVSGNNLYIDIFLLDFLENLILKEKECDKKYRIEKKLNSELENKSFSLFLNEDLLLKLEFDKEIIEYDNKGIKTKLLKFKERISLQDELANEAAFRAGQRYLQMERDEFEEK